MLAKPVALLTASELKRFRDGMVTKGVKASSINRDVKGLKAALNLAAAHDPRITNSAAWRTGLAALPDAHTARNVILTDEQVRTLIASAYAEDDALGLLVETAAVTGARVSQLGRLEIGDLQADRPDPRVMMPSSRKGRGHKRIDRKPVPITSDLAAKLKRAAGDRMPTESLLLRADGTPWRPATADYRLPFISVVRRVGLDPTTVTLYSLRHSSIVRALLAGVPVRLCAVGHDTSIAMIEKSYSAFISDHADSLLRRALLDVAQPAAGNVVALPGQRP
jgi:integrase